MTLHFDFLLANSKVLRCGGSLSNHCLRTRLILSRDRLFWFGFFFFFFLLCNLVSRLSYSCGRSFTAPLAEGIQTENRPPIYKVPQHFLSYVTKLSFSSTNPLPLPPPCNTNMSHHSPPILGKAVNKHLLQQMFKNLYSLPLSYNAVLSPLTMETEIRPSQSQDSVSVELLHA